jgi:hypothetical protein
LSVGGLPSIEFVITCNVPCSPWIFPLYWTAIVQEPNGGTVSGDMGQVFDDMEKSIETVIPEIESRNCS